jgi:putative inorganic carbon (hco3(-)) transporter
VEEEMKLKSLFNIILFSFLMIVPLIPIKMKVGLLPLSADFIFGSALILVGILYVIITKKGKNEIEKLLNSKDIKVLVIATLVVLFISVISISYAANKTVAITEILRFIEYIAIFMLIILIVDETTIERSFKVFYLTMIFACVFGIAQVFFNWSKFLAGGFLGKERIYATFVNPNYWGAAINLVIFYPIINLMEKKKSAKVDILALAIFLITMLFCSTRGAWIGFMIGLVLIFFLKYKNRLIYLIGSFAILYFIPSIKNRFGETLYATERLNVWKTGFLMFKDNMLLGVGNGNYIYRYKEYIKKYPELQQRKPQYSVHNSYIKMFSELGILGGVSFVLIYLVLFNMAFKIYKSSTKYKTIALAFIGFGAAYLFQNFFNNLVFVPQLNVFVWIICALLYKAYYLEKQ